LPHATLHTFRVAVAAAAVAAAFAGAPARAAGVEAGAAFVNVAGRAPELPVLRGGAGDPAIEKLLTRPSDLWDRLRQGFALRDLDSPLVAKYEAWYAARPELLRAIFGRGKRYLHYIIEEVDRRGLPAELALLPAVESGFNPMALSSANASGLWQFIPGTGTRYKLAQTAHFDARRDVHASTGAALDYLQELHTLVGDWHLALASYNWGENSVIRAVSQSRARGRNGVFEDLSLPEETRNYVPRLLAVRNIVAEPERFGLDLGDLADEPYFVTLKLPSSLDLRVAARLAGLPYEDLLALNPGYTQGYKQASATGGAGATLVVPVESADAAREGFEKYFEERARQKGSRRR
jgi:membrane-bound lytic murein transglycosylase D